MYKCKQCGMAAIVHNGQVHKGCKCKCGVVAEMTAVAKGKGGVKA